MIAKKNIFDILNEEFVDKVCIDDKSIKALKSQKIKKISQFETNGDLFEIRSKKFENLISSKASFKFKTNINDNLDINFQIESNDFKYTLTIDESFNYHIDSLNNIFIWIDVNHKQAIADKVFRFYYFILDDNIELLKEMLEEYFIQNHYEIINPMSSFLESLLKNQNDFKQLLKLIYLAEKIQIDEEKQKIMAQKTISQASSDTWHFQRKLRLTASNFGKIAKRKNNYETLAYQLINNTVIEVPALTYGKETENKACEAYEKLVNKKVQHTGLVIDLDDPWLGGSPDGILNENEVIEIKCAYSGRDASTLHDLVKMRGSEFCINYNGNLKKSHVYYYQVQGIMHITKRKSCDFILYMPKFIHVTKIEYDNDLWENTISSLKRFYHTYYIVELMKSEYLQKKENIENEEVKVQFNHKAISPLKPLNQKNAFSFERILPDFDLEDKVIVDQQQINLIDTNTETKLKEKFGKNQILNDSNDDEEEEVKFSSTGKRTIILPKYTSPLQNKTFTQSKIYDRLFITKQNNVYALSFKDDDMTEIKVILNTPFCIYV